jgi:prepilin-type N-terminal cleavage/methylation domain-containing protein
MKSNIKVSDKQRGFTIIEVVLVLAIAGLIFLVVFLALPALQRSQRDTTRKNDMGRMTSQMNQYQANHKGTLPSDQPGITDFVKNYMLAASDTFVDPSGKGSQTLDGKEAYTVTIKTDDSVPSDAGTIFYRKGANCDGVTGTRNYALRMKLEGGGDYCVGS